MRAFLTGMILVAGLAACGDDETGTGGSGSGSGGGTTGTTSSGATTTATSSSAGTGGEGTGGGAGGEAPIDVEVRFGARVGDEDAACDADYDLGVDGGVTELADLRFYVHDVRLVTSDGDEVALELEQDGLWQVENVAMIDFEDGSGACENGNPGLNDLVRGTAPAGDYVGLKVRLGVPVELNHADVTSSPAPLDDTFLFWSWGFGHIFLSAMTSSTPDGSKAPNVHTVHVGSTGCVGDPELDEEVSCASPNRPELSFAAFDFANDLVVLDVGALLEESNLGTDVGCHSFPDTPACVAPFTSLGLDYATGDETPETMTAFRVEAQ
jgi:uncharacterized repeat protein (TIGR04052 family)